MSVALNATTTAVTLLENITTKYLAVDPVLIERERIRMEFYQTYDMMTGVSTYDSVWGSGLGPVITYEKSRHEHD